MGFVLVLIIGVVIVGGAWYVQHRLAEQRRAAVFALAQRLGFTYSADDVNGVLALDFFTLERGDGQRARNFVHGVHAGRPVQIFDFDYYEESSGKQRSRTWYHLNVAMMTIDAAVSHLRIGHEGFAGKLANLVGFDDIELEYGDFNDRFRVLSADRTLAFSLLDGQMMEWLMGAGGIEALELHGPHVLVAVDRIDPSEWDRLLDFLAQFHERIPRVVFSTYPAR